MIQALLQAALGVTFPQQVLLHIRLLQAFFQALCAVDINQIGVGDGAAQRSAMACMALASGSTQRKRFATLSPARAGAHCVTNEVSKLRCMVYPPVLTV